MVTVNKSFVYDDTKMLEDIDRVLLKEAVREILPQVLDLKEEWVLRARFGLNGGRSSTLEEAGKEFNVTRERIRQVEAKALRKLRCSPVMQILKEYL